MILMIHKYCKLTAKCQQFVWKFREITSNLTLTHTRTNCSRVKMISSPWRTKFQRKASNEKRIPMDGWLLLHASTRAHHQFQFKSRSERKWKINMNWRETNSDLFDGRRCAKGEVAITPLCHAKRPSSNRKKITRDERRERRRKRNAMKKTLKAN